MTRNEWNLRRVMSETPVSEIQDRESYNEGFKAGTWRAAEEVQDMMIGLSDELSMRNDSTPGAGLALRKIEGVVSEIQDLQPEEG